MPLDPQFYSITELNTAIADTLLTSSEIKRSQDVDDLTEQIPDSDMPLAQVYPQSWVLVGGDSETTFNTFGGGLASPVQRIPFIFHADIYIAQRALLAENMTKYLVVAQSVNDLLLAQRRPYFGHTAIKSMAAEGERVIMEYSEITYLAIRYTITIEVF